MKRDEKRQLLRECHKCPLNGKGDDYCWRECLGPADDSRKGISKVSLGAMESEGEFVRSNIGGEERADGDARDESFVFFDERADDGGDGATPPSPVTASLNWDTERGLAVVLANLFALPDIQLCILRHLLFGEDYATIGRTLPKPMSKQAVEKHLSGMRGKCAFVARVMRGMQLRGVGGAKRRQAHNMEFEFA